MYKHQCKTVSPAEMQGVGGFSSGAWCCAPAGARGRRPVADWAVVAADCTAVVVAVAGCTVAAAAGCTVSAAVAERAEECSGGCFARRPPPDRRAEGLGWWAPRSPQLGERHT